MPAKTRNRLPQVKKPVPFEFIFDFLAPVEITRKSMFGCTALYLGEKIVLILREKDEYREDNGIWVATAPEHHESLRKDFPSLRSIGLFGAPVTSWQNLPSESSDFESAAERICRLVMRGDSRIGKVPERRKRVSRSRPAKGRASKKPRR